jgi:hypothetical protein
MKILDGRRVDKTEVVCPCGLTFEISEKQKEAGRGRRCSKACQYKYPSRPSGLVYNIVAENSGWYKPGDNTVEQFSETDLKICCVCKVEKLCSQFYKKDSGCGFRSTCIECGKLYKNSPENNRANSSRYRATKVNQLGYVPKNLWSILIECYGNKCLCCGSEENLELDHVIPLSWATIETKLHDFSNFQILCRSCNAKKRDKHIDFRTFIYILEEV